MDEPQPEHIRALYRRAWRTRDHTARAALEAALPALRTSSARAHLTMALMGFARLAFDAGDLRRCGTLLDEGVSALRPEDDRVLWARLLNFRSFLSLECGQLAEAIEPLTAVMRQMADTPGRELLQASVNLGHCLQQLGDVEGALPVFTAGLELARRLGGPSGIAHCCHSLFKLHLDQGDEVVAAARLEELEALAEDNDSEQIHFEACLARSRALHHHGAYEASMAAALAARSHTASWQTPQDRAHLYYRAGRAALDAGRIEQAEQYAAEARDRLRIMGDSEHRTRILALCTELARRRGDAEALAALVALALEQPGRATIARALRLSSSRHLDEVYQLREIELTAKSEALARARAAAAAASAERQQFLATMSHELRTPLHGVIGTAELLTEQPMPPAAQELLGIIQASGALTLGIVDDILDFQKLEEGRLSLDPVDFPLAARIAGPIELLTPRARAKGTVLVMTIGEGLPRHVRGDDRRLQQVLLNLLGNALKFTPGGKVVLSVQPDTRSGHVRFSVRDNGDGISAAALPTLFTPYTQATPGTARRAGGTGLGLAICKQLVELAGGQLGVESTLGEGSTFWFTLPLPPSATVVRPARLPPAAKESVAGVRILLVEDHAINRMLVSRMLSGLGAEVRTVNDGGEAVRVAPLWQPELVLMDMHMPVLDGPSATRRLRHLGYEGEILALTASAMETDRATCIAAGMDGFLTKPVTRAAFLDALSSMHAKSAASASGPR